jgi:hypothetical protein
LKPPGSVSASVTSKPAACRLLSVVGKVNALAERRRQVRGRPAVHERDARRAEGLAQLASERPQVRPRLAERRGEARRLHGPRARIPERRRAHAALPASNLPGIKMRPPT